MNKAIGNSAAPEGDGLISSLVTRFNAWWSQPTEQNEPDEQMGSNIHASLLGVQYRHNSASEIPSYVECPIALQIYRNPVMLVEAQMVIEEAMVEHLTICPGGPNIGKQLLSKTYFPDIGTKKAVEAYLKRHPEKDNSDDRYPDYPPSLAGNAPVTIDVLDDNYTHDFCYKEFGCSNKFGGVLLFSFIGGIAVGLYYAIMAVPCRHLALKNLTGEPLSFTYQDTVDDDRIYDCSIDPWQDVPPSASIYLDRSELLTCTFYTVSGIDLHTSAFKVSSTREDANGCGIKVEKASAKCSWDLFKECSDTIQDKAVAEIDEFYYLRG